MDIRDLKKEIWKAYNERSVWTQKSDVDKFKKLLDELDDVNKVVLPKRIADWIREAAQPSNITTVSVMYRDAIRYGKHIDWFRKPDNQRLLLRALLYGYEVKKEPRYRIKLPGLSGNNGQQYISKSADGKLFACAYRDYLQQEFTNDELKQLPDWVRRLEFEEVES
ncbi:DUF1642 domain-containing protein [Pediococcus acidilactici]|uniref:DUF1642 domain-containing protein n=1 Tax=Pediococcus acidilactici TaxID=1254 RepID=UPI002FBE05FD